MIMPFLLAWIIIGFLAGVYVYILIKEKSIIGKHFDCMICDDLISENNTLSSEEINKRLKEWIEWMSGVRTYK